MNWKFPWFRVYLHKVNCIENGVWFIFLDFHYWQGIRMSIAIEMFLTSKLIVYYRLMNSHNVSCMTLNKLSTPLPARASLNKYHSVQIKVGGMNVMVQIYLLYTYLYMLYGGFQKLWFVKYWYFVFNYLVTDLKHFNEHYRTLALNLMEQPFRRQRHRKFFKNDSLLSTMAYFRNFSAPSVPQRNFLSKIPKIDKNIWGHLNKWPTWDFRKLIRDILFQINPWWLCIS